MAIIDYKNIIFIGLGSFELIMNTNFNIKNNKRERFPRWLWGGSKVRPTGGL